jgi:hypothetical protein
LEGPRAQCNVKLAHTPCEFNFICIYLNHLMWPLQNDLVHAIYVPGSPPSRSAFLYDQLLVNDTHTSDNVPLSTCPRFEGRVKIFNSASATFFTLSDPSSVGGMQYEHICAVPSWH